MSSANLSASSLPSMLDAPGLAILVPDARPSGMAAWLEQGFPPLLSWCVLVAAAALAGHLTHRFTGFPRILGYTAGGLIAGWLGLGDLPWPLHGTADILLQMAVGTSLLLAASQVSLPWLVRQPWLLLQSLSESLLTLAATAAVLLALDQGWAVALVVGAVAMAASPAVLLRITADLRASGAVTDRSVLLATLSSIYALIFIVVLTQAFSPVLAGEGLEVTAAGLGRLLLGLGLSVLWAALVAAALWPVLRWKSSRSDTTALYMLAALAAACMLAERWGGSAALSFAVAGLLLRNLSAKPLVWPSAFNAANAMLNLLMFVLVASMAAQVAFTPTMAAVVAAVVLARLAGKLVGILLLGQGTALGWRRQWPVACMQAPLSGLALVLVSGVALQWGREHAQLVQSIAAIALPMIVVCELLGVLLASTALWHSGEAHRGIGRAALKREEKRHDS